MMMECPRCGFAQPLDRYCASCGLDVENYVVQPKPLIKRLVQDPNSYLSLIVILVVLLAAYLFFAQRERWSRQVGRLFTGTPLTSRDAADPNTPKRDTPPKPQAEALSPDSEPGEDDSAVAAEAPVLEKVAEKAAVMEPQKLEVSHWEVSREVLNAITTGSASGAEKLAETALGKVYLIAQGKTAFEAVTSGKRLAATRSTSLATPTSVITETPPTSPEAFQYGLLVQPSKPDSKEVYPVRWDSTLVIAAPDASGVSAVPGAPPPPPQMRALNEANLTGSTALAPGAVLLLVYEPVSRTLRDDALNRAGEGPWTVFATDEFRTGISDWVVLIQLK